MNEYLELAAGGLLLGISVAAPVGPSSLSIINRGLVGGFGPSILVGLGTATADAAYLFLVRFGVAPLLTTLPWLRPALWVFGFVMLTYLGVSGLASARKIGGIPTAGGDGEKSRNTAPSTFSSASYLAGLGLTLGNPMTILFWLTLGGASFSRLAHLGDAAMTAFVFATLTGIVLWFVTLSALVSYFRRFLGPSLLRIVTTTASLVLLGFASSFGLQALISLRP